MSHLRRFKDYIDHDEEPTVEDVEKYTDFLIEKYNNGELKAGTISQYTKSVLYYWESMGNDPNDVNHIRSWLPTGETDHGDYLTVEEWKRVKESARKPREMCMIEILYRYARRPEEVRLLNMDDIDFAEETITFTIVKKRDLFRSTFDLLDETRRKLELYKEYRSDVTVPAMYGWEDGEVRPLISTSNGRASYTTMWRDMKTVVERAGIEKNITPGALRHTRATHLDWEGKTPEEIARHQLIHDPDTDVIGAYIHDRSEEQVREPLTTDDE